MMKRMLYSCLLAGLLSGACSNQPPKNDSLAPKEQEHEELKQELTAYSADFELFAEADPFVAGEDATVLAHFTFLSDFKPLEQAEVSILLTVDGKSTSQKSNQSTHPGIYQFLLHPETTGQGTLQFIIRQGDQERRVQLDVQVFENDEDAIHYVGEKDSNHETAITFTKEQSWKIDFATAWPVRKPFGPVLKTTALVQPTPAKSNVLVAQTSGIVHYLLPSLVEGTVVRAGQELFRITGTGMGDDNSSLVYGAALADYEKEKTDYERMKLLAEKQIVSQKELLAVQTGFEKSKAIYENLQRNFNSAGQIVVAPANGSIFNITVQNGQFVGAGQPVANLMQSGNIQLKAEFQQKYAILLQQIESVSVRSVGQNDWLELKDLNGKLLSVGYQISAENFLLPVYFEAENNGYFIPGSFAEINLRISSEDEQLVVPNAALIEQQGSFFVFVQIDPEHFEKRQVIPGDSDGLETAVKSGLQAGERIVTKGAVLVKLAAVSGSLDPHAGHVH